MSKETAVVVRREAEKIERVLVTGDLAQLTPEERVSYYRMVCESVGLNPLTKPFAYITLNGKLTLYALKDCTDQLRTINNISVKIVAREIVDECFVVTAEASTPVGRTDGSIGAVSVGNLKGEAKCNAMMKAETKAKRRVTLSICGLGILDETEIESIPSAKPPVEVTSVPIPLPKPVSGGSGKPAGAAKATPQAPPLSSEPTSTDDSEIALCGKSENKSFYAEFRKALAVNLQARTEEIGRAWLKNQGYVKDDGTGSLQRVEKALFPEVIKAATEYARSLS